MFLSFLSFLLLLQGSLPAELLRLEDARVSDVSFLAAALKDSNPGVRRTSVRALGRLERPEHAELLITLVDDPDPTVRAEVYLALIHLQVDPGLRSLLGKEKDSRVRAQMMELLGRLDSEGEPLLRRALRGSDVERTGALRGLEVLVRQNQKKSLSSATWRILGEIVQHDPEALNRRLALTTLLAVENPENLNWEILLSDEDPQVRRLAVRFLGEYRSDLSYLVRYEGLRVSGDCSTAVALLTDRSPHVRILATQLLSSGCDRPRLLETVVQTADPLQAAHALVALASVDPAEARSRLSAFQAHPHWSIRALVARAAVRLKAHDIRVMLLEDRHPNVVAEALVEPAEAMQALRSDDYGLLVRALTLLAGWDRGADAVPALLELWNRITAQGRATSRDPRRLILRRLQEFAPQRLQQNLPRIISDFDPLIADLGARLAGTTTPGTARLKLRSISQQEAFKAQSLVGGRARVLMRDSGEFWLELLAEEAPVTVLRFVERAENGYFDGLTFHRIESNFVIQGGSPGANEYVGTSEFTRDELSSLSHLRGTVGISTRGRDTGDGQIFVNLVDNYRLDHNYTIFARVSKGMSVVDRIRETDVIESVEILQPAAAPRLTPPIQNLALWTHVQYPRWVYRQRRERLRNELKAYRLGSAMVPSAPGRSGGATFRQNPDFEYFTGLEIPDSLLLVDLEETHDLLFVPEEDARFSAPGRPNDFPGRPLAKDPKLERLSGLQIKPVREFEDWLAEQHSRGRAIALRFASFPSAGLIVDVRPALEDLFLERIRRRFPALDIQNANDAIGALRSVKDRHEVRTLRRAALATSRAITEAARTIRPGLDERTLAGTFEAACKVLGAPRLAFDSILKSGPNSLWPWRILAAHYDRRNQRMMEGELVILGVGCEMDHYVSDVGRTFPVSGSFSQRQAELVEMVRRASDAAIAAVRPGVRLSELRRVILPNVPEAERRHMQTGSFFGHHLGLEIGDPSVTDAPLKSGMVFTIEPWYYNHQESVAVFLEDVILVTDSGAENLTKDLPRSSAELEGLMK